jgi:uncharacterized Zn-binding protein involved in type VI secretion
LPEAAAARFDDPVAHSHALGGFVAGALVGVAAAIGVAMVVGAVATAVAAEVVTGGLATPLVAGIAVTLGELAVNLVAGGWLTSKAEELGESLGSQSFGSPSGKIAQGSATVIINDKPAARVTDKTSCDNSPVAQGSDCVFINGQPASRLHDKLNCGGAIVEASPNVFIGGGTITVGSVASEVPTWVRWAAIILPIIPAIGGLARAIGPALAEVEAQGFSRALQSGAKAVGRAMEERAGGVRGAAEPSSETVNEEGVAKIPPKRQPYFRPDLDDKWFDDNGELRWPPNDGFAETPTDTTLPPGTQIDRFGRESGTFLSPQGSAYGDRALPYDQAKMPYYSYEVVKPLPVKAGTAAPWFDESGTAVQYKTSAPVEDLVKDGYLRRIGQ